MRMPDFFIAGAPKCGTTALYSYLQTYPGIFMPGPKSWAGQVSAKEPHYFCFDFPDYRRYRSLDDYRQLFAEAPADAMIGEGSVWYLYSEVAVPEIMAVNPRAKFIILLRNPVDMADSLHNLLFHTLDEDIEDLAVAWDMQAQRARGQQIPRRCRESRHLLYREVCSFYPQVERLLAHVPREQCMIIISEEFRAAPAETYRQVLQFLGWRWISGLRSRSSMQVRPTAAAC